MPRDFQILSGVVFASTVRIVHGSFDPGSRCTRSRAGSRRLRNAAPPNWTLELTIAVGRPLRGLPLALAAQRRYVDMERPCKLYSTGSGCLSFSSVAAIRRRE